MPQDAASGSKRPLEVSDDESKRPKTDSSSASEDLEYLKSSIKQELVAEFEPQFRSLHQQISDLQQKYTELAGKVPGSTSNGPPPALPPRTSSASLASATTKTPVLTRNPSNNDVAKPKHTFGGTSFNIKPMAATPTNSMTNPPQVEKTPKDPPATQETTSQAAPAPAPKPVFGSSTSFGNSSFSESMKDRKNVFADMPSQAAASSSSSFGANSKFSNAFSKSLAKKSFLDTNESEKTQEQTASSPSNDNNDDKSNDTGDADPGESQQQVKLAPVKNTTGEEDEKSHFSTTCKLFELNLSDISGGWKERGLGQIHLNQSYHDPNQVRLVMRSNGLLRVILNNKITTTTEFFKGSEATLNPGKYLRFNAIKDDSPVQYLLKFSNQALRDELIGKIDELKQQIVDSSGNSRANSKEPEVSTATGVQWT